MPESHTGLNIRAIIDNISEEFGISSQDIPFITDSASNMKLAFAHTEWYPCMLHRLHTSIDDAWNQTLEYQVEIKLLFTKMQSVRNFFHRSANKEIRLPKKLPGDSVTRPWTGLSRFFNAFCESYKSIEDISISHCFEIPTDLPLMTQISKVFQIFDAPFNEMQGSKYSTTHIVCLSVWRIFSKLNEIPQRLVGFKDHLKSGKFLNVT